MNKYFSDYLPAVMVKDLRQAFRSRGYVSLLVLCVAGAWLDWLSAWYQNEGTGSWLTAILIFLFVFCIPWRAGSAVRADTKVKGTNFLMLTPITSRRIVWSVWASTVLQMLPIALLLSPLMWYRVTHSEPDDLFANMLYVLLPLGAFVAALQMFASRLNVLLRFGLLFWVLKLVITTLLDSQSWVLLLFHQGQGRLELTPWQYAGMAALLVLAVVLLLEFTRRYYAPLSENCSMGYRMVLPLVFAVGAGLCWLEQSHISYQIDMGGFGNSISGPAVSYSLTEVSLESIAATIMLVAAMADAVMPSCRIAAHDRRCVNWLPKVLQVPGIAAATLWLLIAYAASVVLEIMSVWPSATAANTLGEQAQNMVQECLTAAYPVLLCLLVLDVSCKRESTLRPVLFCVMYVATIVVGGIALAISMMGLSAPDTLPAWCGLLPLPSFAADWDVLPLSYYIVRAVCSLVFVTLLLYRGRLKKVA